MRFAQISNGIVTWIFYSAVAPDLPDVYEVSESVQLEWIYTEGEFKPSRAIKDAQIEIINAACAAEIVAGVYSEASGVRRKYDSDIVDQLNFMQAMKMAELTGEPVSYRCWKENGSGKEWVPHTYAQFCQVLADGAVSKAALLLKCSTIKDAIEEARTVEEIKAQTW